MNKYRRRFIWLNMCLIGAVLILMMTAISVRVYQEYWAELETTLSQVIAPLDSSYSDNGEVIKKSSDISSAESKPGSDMPSSDVPNDISGSGASRSDASSSSSSSNSVPSGDTPSGSPPTKNQSDGGSSDSSSSSDGIASGSSSSKSPTNEDMPGSSSPSVSHSSGSGSSIESSSSSTSSTSFIKRILGIGDTTVTKEERKNFITAFYKTESGELSVLTDDPFVDDETLFSAAEAAYAEDEDYGVLKEYSLIYYRQGTGSLCKLAFASTSYIYENMTSFIFNILLIFIATMAVVYLISRYISKLAVQPVELAWQREKQFVADISHDLKTPLAVVKANLSILRSDGDISDEEKNRWIDGAEEAVNNMRLLVDEMITLSQAGDSDAEIKIEKIDFSEIVEKAVMQLEPVAYDNGIEIIEEIARNITIKGNSDYICRIAMSLIENAIKYETEGGKVYVNLSVKKKQAVLSVRNLNSVIAPEDLLHVFERFYRADKARGSRDGHGLGLAIAKDMTEKMGGRIEVHSESNTGTEFKVSFKVLGENL
ncbi:MAG: HAMP domain-containing histidine kinase [Clostridiales bacterium]|nr:HAMP domain-containing histidine kinase [Clostridiales bacterium]